MTVIRWGIVGTGQIASEFAAALQGSRRHRLQSVVGSSPEKAAAFARRFGVVSVAGALPAMLGDNLDLVYIATPHTHHAEQARLSLEHGKSVLCEKPLTVDPDEARILFRQAAEKRLLLMEGYMYRCHPWYARLLEYLRAGAIGRLRRIESRFGYYLPRDPAHRAYRPDLAGGGIWDVGGYPLSLCLGVAGAVSEADLGWRADGVVGPTGVDEYAEMALDFPGDIRAWVACAVHRDIGTATVIEGDKGRIELADPWLPEGSRRGRVNRMLVHRDGQPEETVETAAGKTVFALEADWAADSLTAGRPLPPAVQPEESLLILRLQSMWCAAIRETGTTE